MFTKTVGLFKNQQNLGGHVEHNETLDLWLLVEKQVTQGQLFRNSLNLNRCSPDTEIFSKRRKIYSRLRGELEDDVKLRTYRLIPNLCIDCLPRLLLWTVGAWMHLKARCMPCLPGPDYMSPATQLSEAIPTQSTPQVHIYRWHSQLETGFLLLLDSKEFFFWLTDRTYNLIASVHK